MSKSIKIKVKRKDDFAEVKCLLVHPMETGARKDPASGELVPRDHITQVTFALNGAPVMIANCSTAVSKNPYFKFNFAGATAGDKFSVNWQDLKGESDSIEVTLD